jgi:serine/threonine protein kinase
VGSQLAAGLRNFLSLPDAERTLGQYHLLHQLGSGGFAPVWLAAERYGSKELRKVAVKLFATGETAREDLIVEEAQALCNVEHPNVVRFYTFTKDPANHVLGLVMEYVRGVSLDKRLEEREKLPAAEAIELGLAVSSALEAVHRVGLVHRDLKPANVIVSEGVYKLIDFGIASADEPVKKPARKARQVVLDDLPLDVAATKASMLAPQTLGGVHGSDGENPFAALAGTLGYMDPRCVSSQERATPASDLYALGATLFECVVGMLPAVYAAKASGGYGLKGEVLDGRSAAPSLADAAPDAPPGLVRVVDQLLQVDPTQRPTSAGAVVSELRLARVALEDKASAVPTQLGGHGSEIVSEERAAVVALAGQGASPTGIAFGSSDPGPPARRRSRMWAVYAAGGGVACAAAAALLVMGRGSPGTPAAAIAPPPTATSVAAAPPPSVPSAAPPTQEAKPSLPEIAASASSAATGPSRAKAPAAGTHATPKASAAATQGAATPAPAATAATTSVPGGVVVQSPY